MVWLNPMLRAFFVSYKRKYWNCHNRNTLFPQVDAATLGAGRTVRKRVKGPSTATTLSARVSSNLEYYILYTQLIVARYVVRYCCSLHIYARRTSRSFHPREV